MKFEDVFHVKKPVMAMLHLKGETHEEVLQRAKRETDLLFGAGADAVIVEDYFGDEQDVVAVLEWLQKERPDALYGVNLLDQFEKSYQLAERYGAKFMQVDSVAGHLSPEDDAEYGALCEKYHEKGTVLVLGGVRFKYKPVLSGRSLEEDLRLGMQRCDAIVVTGEGTGMNTSLEKIQEFRDIMGEFPLIVGAGLTAQTAGQQLSVGDGAIVGSTLKDTRTAEGDVCSAYVEEFMAQVNQLREGH